MRKGFSVFMYVLAFALMVFVVSATTLGIEHKTITDNIFEIIVAFICAIVAFINGKMPRVFGGCWTNKKRVGKIVINLYK